MWQNPPFLNGTPVSIKMGGGGVPERDSGQNIRLGTDDKVGGGQIESVTVPKDTNPIDDSPSDEQTE